MSRINLNQTQAEDLIYLLSKENIEIKNLDLSGNYVHTVPDISKLKCTALNLDGNEISCLPDNKNIPDFIKAINLSNNIFYDLQIIAFCYISQIKSAASSAAIDIGLTDDEISAVVNDYKAAPDETKIEIIKEFVDQQFSKNVSVKSVKQELLRLRSLLEQSDRVTAIGIVELIKFYIEDKSSNGFTAMAEKHTPPQQPKSKRTKHF